MKLSLMLLMSFVFSWPLPLPCAACDAAAEAEAAAALKQHALEKRDHLGLAEDSFNNTHSEHHEVHQE